MTFPRLPAFRPAQGDGSGDSRSKSNNSSVPSSRNRLRLKNT